MTRPRHSHPIVVGACREALRRAIVWSPRWFAISVLLDLLLAVLPAAQVMIVGWLVSSVAGDHRRLSAAVISTATVVGAMYMLAGLREQVWTIQRSIQQTTFMCELRGAIAALRPSQLADPEVATRIRGARAAVDYTLNGLAANIMHVFSAGVTAITLLFALWRWSWLAALLVVLSLIPMIAMYHVLSGARRQVIRRMSDNNRLAEYCTDQLVYQRTATELASLGTSDRMVEWGDAPTLANNRIVQGLGQKSMIAEVVSSLVITGLVMGALFAIVTSENVAGAATAGILGIMSGIAATRDTGAALGQIILAIPLMEAYTTVVDEARAAEPETPIRTGERLHVTDLSVRYPGRDDDSLHGVTLSVKRGEMIAIVGPNGAGKTTFVNAVLGILPAHSGAVCLDGEDLSTMGEQRRIAHCGHLTQEFGRYELTVRQSLWLASPGVPPSDDALWQALSWAHADEFVRRLPHGLDSQLGQQWGGVGISGGQWQRLSLARIYLRNAAIWILDEPTSAVDAESEAAIFSELAESKQDHITVVISHRAATLRRMDRIYVIDGGQLVQQGTYDELAHSPGRFREMFTQD